MGHVCFYIFRWILAILFGGFGWVVIINNFAVVYVWLVRRKHSSSVPLVGGIFALAGMAFCPVQLVQRFAFVPLFIDVGYFIIATAIGLLLFSLLHFTRHSSLN